MICETAMYSVCGETNYIQKGLNWRHLIVHLTSLIKLAKTSYFVPFDYIVVGIQVEKNWGNPHEKYRAGPEGGVIKECDKGCVIKGCDKVHVHLFISGMQKFCIS